MSEERADYTAPTVDVLPDPPPDATGVMHNGHWYTRADVYAHNIQAHRQIARRLRQQAREALDKADREDERADDAAHKLAPDAEVSRIVRLLNEDRHGA